MLIEYSTKSKQVKQKYEIQGTYPTHLTTQFHLIYAIWTYLPRNVLVATTLLACLI